MRCAFRNCRNNHRNCAHRIPQISFFAFPVRDRPRCIEWIVQSQREDFYDLELSVLKNRRICSAHFLPEEITCSGRLHANTVPRLHDANDAAANIVAPRVLEAIQTDQKVPPVNPRPVSMTVNVDPKSVLENIAIGNAGSDSSQTTDSDSECSQSEDESTSDDEKEKDVITPRKVRLMRRIGELHKVPPLTCNEPSSRTNIENSSERLLEANQRALTEGLAAPVDTETGVAEDADPATSTSQFDGPGPSSGPSSSIKKKYYPTPLFEAFPEDDGTPTPPKSSPLLVSEYGKILSFPREGPRSLEKLRPKPTPTVVFTPLPEPLRLQSHTPPEPSTRVVDYRKKVPVGGAMPVCRLCMKPGLEMVSIFSDVNQPECLVDKIQAVTGLVMVAGDGLPMQICSSCNARIADWFNYKQMCYSSDTKFRALAAAMQKAPPGRKFSLGVNPAKKPTSNPKPSSTVVQQNNSENVYIVESVNVKQEITECEDPIATSSSLPVEETSVTARVDSTSTPFENVPVKVENVYPEELPELGSANPVIRYPDVDIKMEVTDDDVAIAPCEEEDPLASEPPDVGATEVTQRDPIVRETLPCIPVPRLSSVPNILFNEIMPAFQPVFVAPNTLVCGGTAETSQKRPATDERVSTESCIPSKKQNVVRDKR